jgi:hypothetical protein
MTRIMHHCAIGAILIALCVSIRPSIADAQESAEEWAALSEAGCKRCATGVWRRPKGCCNARWTKRID